MVTKVSIVVQVGMLNKSVALSPMLWNPFFSCHKFLWKCLLIQLVHLQVVTEDVVFSSCYRDCIIYIIHQN